MNSSYGLPAAICAPHAHYSRIQYTLGFYEHFYHCSLVVPSTSGERNRYVCTYCAAACCLPLPLLLGFLFDNEEDLEMEKSAVTATFLKITIDGSSQRRREREEKTHMAEVAERLSRQEMQLASRS